MNIFNKYRFLKLLIIESTKNPEMFNFRNKNPATQMKQEKNIFLNPELAALVVTSEGSQSVTILLHHYYIIVIITTIMSVIYWESYIL